MPDATPFLAAQIPIFERDQTLAALHKTFAFCPNSIDERSLISWIRRTRCEISSDMNWNSFALTFIVGMPVKV
jgi:hypothetical protein